MVHSCVFGTDLLTDSFLSYDFTATSVEGNFKLLKSNLFLSLMAPCSRHSIVPAV